MKTRSIIDRIFLRVQDQKGKWGAYSLRECVVMGRHQEIREFIVRRLEPGSSAMLPDEFTESEVEALVEMLPNDSYVALKQ